MSRDLVVTPWKKAASRSSGSLQVLVEDGSHRSFAFFITTFYWLSFLQEIPSQVKRFIVSRPFAALGEDASPGLVVVSP